MSDVRIVLPLRLVSETNAREHWAARAARAKAHRTTAGLALSGPTTALRATMHACAAVGVSRLDRAEWLAVWITRIAPRMLDDDNLAASAKHVRDGVADALGIDDRDPRVSWHYGQRRAAQDERPATVQGYGVEIVVTRAGRNVRAG